MTRQEIFTKVYKHLLTQKKKASQDNGLKCVYKTKRGLKCAIGCLIPATLYKKEWDVNAYSPSEIMAIEPKMKKILGNKRNIVFLNEIQFIHDSIGPRYWEQELKDFAQKWNVKAPSGIS